MNNILFLDIDGVLKHPTQNVWYPEAITFINDYCSHNDIHIVISSTWRLIKDIAFFNNFLNNRVIGKTNDLSLIHKEFTRHYECVDYLKNNLVKNYVIVDDHMAEYRDLTHAVEINSTRGIGLKDIVKINNVLKGSIDYLIIEEITIIDKFK